MNRPRKYRMAWKVGKGDARAWKYVGRFVWSFANIEGSFDTIFETMFNLNTFSTSLLCSYIDLRRKVRLVELGFERQGLNHGKALTKFKKLADIRNIIVHSQFDHHQTGIEFFHIDKDTGREKVLNPELIEEQAKKHKRKQKQAKREQKNGATRRDDDVLPDEEEAFLDTQTITYSQFDKYDKEARQLMIDFTEIADCCEPINDGARFVRDISKIISSSENVLLFAKPLLRV